MSPAQTAVAPHTIHGMASLSATPCPVTQQRMSHPRQHPLVTYLPGTKCHCLAEILAYVLCDAHARASRVQQAGSRGQPCAGASPCAVFLSHAAYN